MQASSPDMPYLHSQHTASATPQTPASATPQSRALAPSAHGAYFVLVNTAITLFLVGAVLVISNNLDRIPVVAFIALFSLLSVLMAVLTLRALDAKDRHGLAWARTWAYWGCVFLGIAAVSVAHRMGWLAFIPDLVLVWLIVFSACALALGHRLGLLVAQVLLTLWLLASFLYGQSYVPGLVVCAVLTGYLVRHPHAGLLVLNAGNALLLAGLYSYAALLAQHYPLHWPPDLLLPLLGALVLLWSASVAANQMQPARRDYRLLAHVVCGLGGLLLVLLCLPPVWALVLGYSAGPVSPTALVLAGLCGILAAVLLARSRVELRRWRSFALWVLAPVLLEMARVAPDTAWSRQFSAVAAVFAVAVALRLMRHGVLARNPAVLGAASGLLVVVVCAAVFSRELPYGIWVLALWGLVTVLLWPLWQTARMLRAGSEGDSAVGSAGLQAVPTV